MIIKKILFTILCIITFIFYFFHGFNEFYFLRTPIRNVPNDNSLFVSPANGKIIKVIKQEDLTDWETELYKKNHVVINDWTKGFSWATLISIMMTPLDAHYQKAPTLSKMIDRKYVPWHFYNATKSNDNMKSTFQNEYASTLFTTPENYRFRIIQIAWYMAWRVVSFPDFDDILDQWDFIGLIKLGSQVSIVLDNNFDILAKEWDYVIDWETILAKKKSTDLSNAKFTKEEETEIDEIIEQIEIGQKVRTIHPSQILTYFWIIILIVQLFALATIFWKAKYKKRFVLIPWYNFYLAYRLAGKRFWILSIFILPLMIIMHYTFIINGIWFTLALALIFTSWIITQIHIAKNFWKKTRFWLCLWLFPNIFYPYLAWFDKNKYQPK